MISHNRRLFHFLIFLTNTWLVIVLVKTIFGNQEPFQLYRGSDFDRSAVADENLTYNSVFLYKAYYDLRDPEGPRIRLLLEATCQGIGGRFQIHINGKDVGVEWIFPKASINGDPSCPNDWDTCHYQAYDIASMVYWGEAPDTVTVFHEDVSVEVKLHRAPSPSMYTNDISVCVGPMHWFNDWPRLIVFAEYLKSQGIKKDFSRFVAGHCFHSTNMLVMLKRSVVYSIQWNPNLYTYNVAHHREMYDCGFWSASKWTFYGDLDDLPYIRNRSTSYFDYLESWLPKEKDLGSLHFQHVGLTFRPRITEKPFDYESFLKLDFFRDPIVFDNFRYAKSAWLTKYVRQNYIHWPWKYFSEKRGINIPKEEALYLHMRANFDWDPNVTRIENRKYMDVKFFEEKEIDEKLEEIRERIREILREEKPEYRGFEVMAAMDRCVKRLKQEDEPFNRTECWNPGAPCFGDIYPLDEWVLAKPEENNKFHIL